ncbi:unnamed protein product, partial [Gulo gulo]
MRLLPPDAQGARTGQPPHRWSTVHATHLYHGSKMTFVIKKHLSIFFWGGMLYFAKLGCLSPLRVLGDVPGQAEVGAPSELISSSALVRPPGRSGEKGLCLILSPDQPGHHRPWLSLAVKGQEGALPVKVHFCEAG